MKTKFIKRNDIILILSILIVCLIIWIINFISSSLSINNSYVDVYVSDSLYGTYSLNSDNTIDIKIDNEIKNVLTIGDNKAYFTYATCPDKLCIHQKKISNNNESLCCLPNKILVIIRADETGDYDAISQ